MSLGPQWCLGVLLGLLLPGQAPRARPGAFGTDLGSPLGAGRRRRAAGEVARRILPMQDSGTFAALAAAKTLAASIRESVALRTLRIDRSVGLKIRYEAPFWSLQAHASLGPLKKA